MELSIVIPAYNESGKIHLDIMAAAEFLKDHHITGEIIVVDDGSQDHTSQVARYTEIPSFIHLEVMRTDVNRGKGHAVRNGILSSRGKYVMFADSGYCVPYENALTGLGMLKEDKCDVSHGSRKMRGCHIIKSQNIYRRICSRFFHWAMIHAIRIPAGFTDTQCGFKIYKGDVARKIYSMCVTDGFMFDVETILLAIKMGYRIMEFPVDWTNDRDSRLSPLRTSWQVLKELTAIKRNLAQIQLPKATAEL